jgi:hypothetical protein
MFIQPVCANTNPTSLQICHPKYETARVILAILDDPRFENLDEPILAIQKNDSGYLVITASHEMQIDVKYLPSTRCGHLQFELIFNDPKISSFSVQALHPKYQTAREIRAILEDSRLFEKLGNEFVLEIRKTEGGYVIHTRSFEIQVDVNYLPPSIPGIIGEPARFELVFSDPIYTPNMNS